MKTDKYYEVTIDAIKEKKDTTFVLIEDIELSFNGSIVEQRNYSSSIPNENLYSMYIPEKNNNIILLPEDIVDHFNLYSYCDDHIPEISYENLEYVDNDLVSLFGE